jgi:glutamate synthase (NADPH/NADH) large chain
VATQDPELRAKFAGTPEHVIRYFFYVAEELRGIMAGLGFRALKDMVGRSDCLKPRKEGLNPKARMVDTSEILYRSARASVDPGSCMISQDHKLEGVLDHAIIAKAMPALEEGRPVVIETAIRNSDRATGAMLSGQIARRYRSAGLPQDTIRILARGSAGQSFGAFASPGMTLELVGDANDYVGKGLSGGIIAVRPPAGSTFLAHEQVIVGNVVLYGATSGRAFFNGRAGERFAILNSGAATVVEGVGDHGCEYMTGGLVVVLGPVGRNFAAGMSGGLAYVYDEEGSFEARCNKEMVELLAMDRQDGATVQALLREHRLRTGSPRAEAILAGWDTLAARFVKVYPSEYRRALEAASAPATNALPISELSPPDPGDLPAPELVADEEAR